MISEISAGIAAIASAIGGAIGGWMLFRRKLSKDDVEITKDRAEVEVITLLRTQRDEAFSRMLIEADRREKAELKAQESTEQMDKLVYEVSQLKTQIAVLRQLVTRLAHSLEEAKRIIDESSTSQTRDNDC